MHTAHTRVKTRKTRNEKNGPQNETHDVLEVLSLTENYLVGYKASDIKLHSDTYLYQHSSKFHCIPDGLMTAESLTLKQCWSAKVSHYPTSNNHSAVSNLFSCYRNIDTPNYALHVMSTNDVKEKLTNGSDDVIDK